MQNFNHDNKNVHTFKKDANYRSHSTQSSREIDFIQKNPVVFIIIEWAAIALANLNSVGVIFGSILSIAAIIGGVNYTKINKTHGWIMTVVAIVALVFQF